MPRTTDQPLYLQRALQLAVQVANPEYPCDHSAIAKQVSVTIPGHDLARIEVLAERAGLSRGAMCVELLQIALGIVFEQLRDEEGGQEIVARSDERYAELFEELTGESLTTEN